jgi:hypothetical protein
VKGPKIFSDDATGVSTRPGQPDHAAGGQVRPLMGERTSSYSFLSALFHLSIKVDEDFLSKDLSAGHVNKCKPVL